MKGSILIKKIKSDEGAIIPIRIVAKNKSVPVLEPPVVVQPQEKSASEQMFLNTARFFGWSEDTLIAPWTWLEQYVGGHLAGMPQAADPAQSTADLAIETTARRAGWSEGVNCPPWDWLINEQNRLTDALKLIEKEAQQQSRKWAVRTASDALKFWEPKDK